MAIGHQPSAFGFWLLAFILWPLAFFDLTEVSAEPTEGVDPKLNSLNRCAPRGPNPSESTAKGVL
ncbi:hypothetical protein B0537_05565 [Desulforamulus ferrireducens]|uniref:Uncharacterized protein n=1 Tax=Desulforamulus ferrireducens TaxID=1833852 RepID=A0A1S6IV31_9FIRM|nr:hypothetical protein B0537_05565 [Desulforamulus ferrireducens]